MVDLLDNNDYCFTHHRLINAFNVNIVISNYGKKKLLLQLLIIAKHSVTGIREKETKAVEIYLKASSNNELRSKIAYNSHKDAVTCRK